MLSKTQSVKYLFSRNVAGMSRSYHGGHHTASTMNDLPVPQGDWQEEQSKRQSKYNAILATGVLMLAGAIGLAKSSGTIELNYSPPKSLD